MDKTFGEFLTRLRKERGITLREFARRVDLSPEYVCNIEKCRKPAPGADVLERIDTVLNLTADERAKMYDLAANSKNTENAVPEDLTGFLNDNRVILTALRTARDMDATDEDWQEFMAKLTAKKKGTDDQ